MKTQLNPAKLEGKITLHASKSLSHRAIIVASLAQGTSVLHNVSLSNDTLATLQAVEKLGWASYNWQDNCLSITGFNIEDILPSIEKIDCNESATTLRLLIPLVVIRNGGGTFAGAGKLLSRPMNPYISLFKQHNIRYHNDGQTITVRGSFKKKELILDGSVSSQFVSGLLLALPLLVQGFSLRCQGMVSGSYVDLTEEIMALAGVVLERNGFTWQVKNTGGYQPFNYTLEGDYSNGAWFLVAKSLGHQLEIEGLNPNSQQGDKAIIAILKELEKSEEVTLEADNWLDIVPLVAFYACLREGLITHIKSLGRLKDKECDRLEAICYNLGLLGVQFQAGVNHLTIVGQKNLKGGCELKTFNDHRIAMAIALIALHCQEPITLDNSDCVAKSYPHFWQDYVRLGGQLQ